MIVGIIGLGKMGLAIAHRLVLGGHEVVGFDASQDAQVKAQKEGVACADSVQAVAKNARVIWLMLPAGKIIDTVLDTLVPVLKAGDIVIDGGNSFYKDSVRRAELLAQHKILFIDCGTSGGLHGKDLGFSLMIGGSEQAFKLTEPIFKAIAAPAGYAYLGPSGAGHFVKMVHNGIEYALLQAYAEGFDVLKHGPYGNLDLEKVASVWNHGSIIRSWIGELAQNVFAKDQELETISGEIGENLTGQWTVQAAKELGVPVKVIEQALAVRAWSRETGGNYATKVVAMLRNEFGGHAVKKIKKS